MITSLLLLLCGLALLIFGADRFVTGAAQTARTLGVQPLIIGVTIVGIATSMPEVLVGSVAAWDGKTAIAIGNAIGSNIANVGLVLGGAALVLPIRAASKSLRREYLIMCLAAVLPLLLMLDHYLGRGDGLILNLALICMVWWIVRRAGRSTETDALVDEINREYRKVPVLRTSLVTLVLGLVLLLAGAECLVRGAIYIARLYGVSDLVIGLTIVAVGTSLPELAASLMSVLKREADIAIGNVIGSNMFNMLMVLGIPPLIHPDGFSPEVLRRDFPVMVALTIMMGIMLFVSKRRAIGRIDGLLLLAAFCGYQYWLFREVAH